MTSTRPCYLGGIVLCCTAASLLIPSSSPIQVAAAFAFAPPASPAEAGISATTLTTSSMPYSYLLPQLRTRASYSWSLAYGTDDNDDDDDDEKMKNDLAPSPPSLPSPPPPPPPLSTNDFLNRMGNEIDPACSIDDEDCLAFSSLDNNNDRRLVPAFDDSDDPYNYDEEEEEVDPLCDPHDVDCRAFLLPGTTTTTTTTTAATTRFERSHNNNNLLLAAELRTRSASIETERVRKNWQKARCPTTFARVSSSDYVRGVHMEEYPLAVCGGARGGVYVINLERRNDNEEEEEEDEEDEDEDEGRVVARAEGAHIVRVEEDNEDGKGAKKKSRAASSIMARQAMEKLYGKLDGGGVVAVAIHGDMVASSGREGGVKLWRIGGKKGQERRSSSDDNDHDDDDDDAGETTTTGGGRRRRRQRLAPLGSMPGLQDTIVTSLKFDSNDVLWTACYDGTVRAYDVSSGGHDDDDPELRSPLRKPLFRSDFTDSVLDMNLCEELKLGVCATADGGAALFNLEDGQFFVGIMLFEKVAARSVLIVRHKDDDRGGYSVMCGGADGTIHQIPLNIDKRTGRVDEENPFGVSETTDTAISPRHVGPVTTMVSPGDDMFVTGGQDGALRVWDCSDAAMAGDDDSVEEKAQEQGPRTKCIYALTGYKLWLGSVCTDGKRLISDGGDSSVIIRDFSREPETNGKASL